MKTFPVLKSISPTSLLAAFTCVDPKSAKMVNDLTVIFALLGSMRVKAVCKMLMKLITDKQ